MFSCTYWVEGSKQQPSAASSDKLGEVVGEEECSGTCFGGGEKRDKGAEGSQEVVAERLPSRPKGAEGDARRAPTATADCGQHMHLHTLFWLRGHHP